MTRPFAEVMRTRTDRRPILAAALALVAGRVVDVGMTLAALSFGAAEMNPAARLAYEHAGGLGMVGLQVAGLTVLLALLAWLPAYRRLGWSLAVAMSWMPVAWNVAVVTGLVRPTF